MRKFQGNYDFLEIHDQTVNVVDWIGDNIYFGCLSGSLIEMKYDQKSKKYYNSLTAPTHNLAVTDICSCADGSKIVSSSLDGTCFVTDRQSLAPIRQIRCKNSLSPHCAINSKGEIVAIVGKDNYLKFKDITKPQKSADKKTEKKKKKEYYRIIDSNNKQNFYRYVQFYGEDENKVIALARHSLSMVDVTTEKTEKQFYESTTLSDRTLRRSLNCLASSPNQRLVAAGTVSGYIQLYDLSSGNQLVHEIKIGGHLIEKLQFSRDGKTLAIAGSNKRVSLLDMAMLQFPYIEQQRSRVISIAFNPDCSKLVSVSEDKTVLIADIIQEEN